MDVEVCARPLSVASRITGLVATTLNSMLSKLLCRLEVLFLSCAATDGKARDKALIVHTSCPPVLLSLFLFLVAFNLWTFSIATVLGTPERVASFCTISVK